MPSQASYAGLHGRVVVVHGDEGDREQHLSIRFLEHPHFKSVTARLKAAMTASGIDPALPFRRLRLLRRGPLPGGSTVEAAFKEFQRRGGEVLSPSDDDLRMLDALAKLRDEKPKDFDAWLAARRPVSRSALLKKDVEWLCSWAKLDAPNAPEIKPEKARQGSIGEPGASGGKAKSAGVCQNNPCILQRPSSSATVWASAPNRRRRSQAACSQTTHSSWRGAARARPCSSDALWKKPRSLEFHRS
jgi:hypothetical protein